MIRYGTLTKLLLPGLVVVGAEGCLGPGGVLGNETGEDLVFYGAITVTTATTGATPDPDGYTASLDEGQVQPIATNGDVTFTVAAGTYGVRLDDYAANCTVAQSIPTYVTVPADSTVVTHFNVDCP